MLLTGGILASGWNALSLTAATEMSGRERAGTAIGVQNTILNAAGALAPVGFAWLVVLTSWALGWGLLAAAQLAGVVVLGPLVAEERVRQAARRERLRAAAERPRRSTCNASESQLASPTGEPA